MTVADYMAACNAHYYATRDPLGKGGDFTTAPEISQIFGELTGAWLAGQWRAQGSPAAFTLLELGPGRGTLMQDALRATRGVPGFHGAMQLRLLEISPVLRALQREALAEYAVEWIETVEALPPLPLFAIANEFFDALPVRQFVGEAERKIDWRDGGFFFTAPAQDITETGEAGESIMRLLANHINRFGGAALVVDYGYDGSARGDTLQAVRAHAYTDPLADPGEADLTAHVDFSALTRAAGGGAHGPVAQGVFLKRLGAELRAATLCKSAAPAQCEAILSGLERLVSPAQMGELFKVLAVLPHGFPPPAGF